MGHANLGGGEKKKIGATKNSKEKDIK